MTTANNLFVQTQLSEAAYADFSGTTGTKQSLIASGFSDAQATEFVKEWSVVDHIPDTHNGFSATIFKNNSTGKYTLAIRGSTDPVDFDADRGIIVDDGIAAGQLVDLYNFWQRANTAAGASYNAVKLTGVSEGTAGAMFIRGAYYITETVSSTELADTKLRVGTGALTTRPASIDVTGHSLGGHLAMAFSRLFPSIATEVVAVNGLGFKIGNPTVNNIFARLGGASSFNGGAIDNIYGTAGPEFAAMNNGVLRQPGSWDGIYVESTSPSAPASLGHGASQMTDSLALYNLYASLSPALQLGAITGGLESVSNTADRSFESALDALRTLLVDGDIATNTGKQTPTGNRDAFYKNLYNLQKSGNYTALKGSAAIVSTAGGTADQAKTDFGRFLALDYLLPFTLLGADSVLIPTHQTVYDAWHADQSLTPEQKAAGEANYSDTWYTDRSKMLTWLLKANEKDQAYVDSGQSLDGAWLFRDESASKSVVVQPKGGMGGIEHTVWFGSDGESNLAGGDKTDRLYGMGGDDKLIGQGGDDYLEGGKGNDNIDGGTGNDMLVGGIGNDTLDGGAGTDTYLVGQGNDTITDSDKKGRIELADGSFLGGGFEKGEDGKYTWLNDNKVKAAQQDADLVVTLKDGSTVTIKDYTDGMFGIELGSKTKITPTNTITGDANDDKKDDLYGTGADDLMDTLTDDDRAHGQGGNDKILGGKGDDRLFGDVGNDLLVGGEGHDTLAGNDGKDRLYADEEIALSDAIAAQNDGATGERGDRLLGSPGDDVVVGDKGNDTLLGGIDNDVIVGGAGDDNIEGDMEIPWVLADWDVTRSIEKEENVTKYILTFSGTDGEFDDSGTGNDTIYAGGGEDWVEAGKGDDFIDGGNDKDVLWGGDGNDIVIGGEGDDVVDGDVSTDTDGSKHGNDTLLGNAGKDEMFGGGGNDALFGGADNDTLSGDSEYQNGYGLKGQFHGDDTLDGGAGDDDLTGDGGNDTLIGGDGKDTLDGDYYDSNILSGQYHGKGAIESVGRTQAAAA
jgi:Ca2+-binding RTX toxin-like protein